MFRNAALGLMVAFGLATSAWAGELDGERAGVPASTPPKITASGDALGVTARTELDGEAPAQAHRFHGSGFRGGFAVVGFRGGWGGGGWGGGGAWGGGGWGVGHRGWGGGGWNNGWGGGGWNSGWGGGGGWNNGWGGGGWNSGWGGGGWGGGGWGHRGCGW